MLNLQVSMFKLLWKCFIHVKTQFDLFWKYEDENIDNSLMP